MKKSKQNIEGLIVQVQQQLTYLDKKIDGLISQLSTRPPEPQQYTKPSGQSQSSQRVSRPGSHGEGRQNDDYMEKVMHKTICAKCEKECEVPFKPSGDRPVYCKVCFAGRKVNSSFKAHADFRHMNDGRGGESQSGYHPRYERRRSSKKVFTKTRKTRS